MMTASIAALAVAALTASGKEQRPANIKPNIVMFFVDDLGYGDLGFTGNPTVETPNIDALANGGKILSSWYSGCPVCSGSRAALMTGRQFNRVGVPGVFGPTVSAGLPLNETTVADQLKKAGYATAIMGKWHLGQRPMYLPGARGFDTYMGIPYSDDMGEARRTPCPGELECASTAEVTTIPTKGYTYTVEDNVHGTLSNLADLNGKAPGNVGMPVQGSPLSPLVFQSGGVSSTPGAQTSIDAYPKNTTVLEQPVDFSTLAPKYREFVVDFIDRSAAGPFFLYMPFSHVHTTAGNQPQKQYASCQFVNKTDRGAFGDALAEVDWLIGEVVAKVTSANILENTLMLFTGDNGPWLMQGLSSGSAGILTGRYSGYWNTGKGSTWDGGIHEAAFAYWKGTITPGTRTHEVTSSLDLFPTASALAGLPLPADRVYDGKDMSAVLLNDNGKSLHEVLFFYGGASGEWPQPQQGWHIPSAARMGCWKAHWATASGMGPCTFGGGVYATCPHVKYPMEAPLLFNVCIDPSESIPLSGYTNGTVNGPAPCNGASGCEPFKASQNDPTDGRPTVADDVVAEVNAKILAALKVELVTFYAGHTTNADLLVGEFNPANASEVVVGICCDKDPHKPWPGDSAFTCDCNGAPYSGSNAAHPSHTKPRA